MAAFAAKKSSNEGLGQNLHKSSALHFSASGPYLSVALAQGPGLGCRHSISILEIEILSNLKIFIGKECMETIILMTLTQWKNMDQTSQQTESI